MATREEKNQEKELSIFNLVTKEWQSTNQIQKLGSASGLYKNWATYDIALTSLEKKGKVERLALNQNTLWRRK